MSVKSLVPSGFYWANPKHEDGELTIVQVSTVFGEDHDFWTFAVIGSDEHQMLSDFDILAPVDMPSLVISFNVRAVIACLHKFALIAASPQSA
jgi:hypothetical protein